MSSGYPDYEGGKQRVYSTADWAALVGKEKGFAASGLGLAYGDSTSVGYVVPPGKTLYLTHLSFTMHAAAEADAELNQICEGRIRNAATGAAYWAQGGNGGGGITFPTPIPLVAGTSIDVMSVNWTNHVCNGRVSCSGYEV